MALTSTIFKAQLQVSDMDRHHYAEHPLTLARHPSETDERMMVRLVAFAFDADEALEFGKGLSTDDEPALWQKDPTGRIELWIEVGQPDERRLRKACGRADRVRVYTFGGSRAEIWWRNNEAALARFDHLEICNLPPEATSALTGLVERNMALSATLQDGQLWLSDSDNNIEVPLNRWK